MGDLKVIVKEIKGHCPVYTKGEQFLITDGYKLESAFPICMHGLSALMPYYVALSKGVSPVELGLGNGQLAYVQCLDPCAYTGGGTVVFEISKE